MSERDIKNETAGNEGTERESTVSDKEMNGKNTAEKEKKRTQNEGTERESKGKAGEYMPDELDEFLFSLNYTGIEKGDNETAMRMGEEWMAEHGRVFGVLAELAKIAMHNEDFERGERLLNELREKRPGNIEIESLYIFYLLKTGKNKEALNKAMELVKERKKIDEKLERLHLMQYLFILNKEFEGAQQLIKQALKYRRSDAHSLLNLGGIALERGEMEEARKNFRRAMRVDPDNYEAVMGVGLLLEKEGEWKKAVSHYRRAIDRFPERENAYERLAHLYAEEGDMENLHDLISIAEESDVEAPSLYIAFAQASLMNREFEDALEHVEDGLYKWPNDESLNALLPVVLGLNMEVLKARVFAFLYQAEHPATGTERIKKIFESLNREAHDIDIESLGEFLSEEAYETVPEEEAKDAPREMWSYLSAGQLDFMLSVKEESPDLYSGSGPDSFKALSADIEKPFFAGKKISLSLLRALEDKIDREEVDKMQDEKGVHYYFMREWLHLEPDDERIAPTLSELSEEEKAEIMVDGKVRLHRGFFMSMGIPAGVLLLVFPEFGLEALIYEVLDEALGKIGD